MTEDHARGLECIIGDLQDQHPLVDHRLVAKLTFVAYHQIAEDLPDDDRLLDRARARTVEALDGLATAPLSR